MTEATPLASEQITQADELAALIAKATQEDLSDGGRYFAEGYDDLTRCRHEEIGEYQNRHDGPLVEFLWNHRHDYLARLRASATPAPSDQDASQAQGEVPIHILARKADQIAKQSASDDLPGCIRAAPGATAQDGVERITAEKLGEIMQEEWGDICDDAQAHPLDMKHGRGTVLFYHPNHWTAQIAAALNRYLSTTPTPTIPAGNQQENDR